MSASIASFASAISHAVSAPLMSAYRFIFPPLEDLLLEHGGEYVATTTSDARALEARRAAALERPVVGAGSLADESRRNGGGSRSGDGRDADLSTWDGFSDTPWSFLTSRYALALVVVALVTNRIQHICRPRGGRPLQLSQAKRLALRLPSLLLMARAVVILGVITASLFLSQANPINRLIAAVSTTSWRQAWLAELPIGGWTQDHFGSASHEAIVKARDAAALWTTFTSISVALVTESLIRSVESDRDEAPSFNLIGFAFMLHLHSFSPTHPTQKHVYLCVFLQTLELLVVALSKCPKRPVAPRLVITSIFGALSSLHFVFTFQEGLYPFMQAFSRCQELSLITIVLLTASLHALTMLLTGERLEAGRLLFYRSNLSIHDDWTLCLFKLGTSCLESTRLTGLSQEVAPLSTFEGPYVEIRCNGSAMIIDQGFSPSGIDGAPQGLAREIKRIKVEESTRPSGIFSSARLHEAIRFWSKLYHTLRALFIIGSSKLCASLGLRLPNWIYPWLRRLRLLWHGSNGEQQREERLAEERHAQEAFRRFQEAQDAHTAWTSGRDPARPSGSLESRMRPRTGTSGEQGPAPQASAAPLGTRPRSRAASPAPSSSLLDAMLWQRFLAPDAILEEEDDQDDDDFEDEAGDDDDEDDDEDEGDVASDDEVDKDGPDGTLPAINVVPENRLMLAHFVRSDHAPPLTRSSYRCLVGYHPPSSASEECGGGGSGGQELDLLRLIAQRRGELEGSRAASGLDVDAERRRLCVVCCVEERNVICWPCRCLSLCNDCRESLASRPPYRNFSGGGGGGGDRGGRGASHLCPTCRTPVEAFSRLYVP
ncbi:hypothetical protein ACQY0O_002492 [Thecaphora frezii]